MKNLYFISGLNFKSIMGFLKELPGASLYAMRR